MPEPPEAVEGTVVPEEVIAMAAERDERRRVKDFGAADSLRDRIAELGFLVTDAEDGPHLEPIRPAASDETSPVERRLEPDRIESALAEPPTVDASVHWIVEGWPDDVVRGIESFRRYHPGWSVQHVVVDIAGTDPAVWPEGIELIPLVDGIGWAKARNCGLRRSRGRLVLLVDGSIEATGDVLGPLKQAFADDSIGVAGPFGIVTHDLRTFVALADAGAASDVDAIEGYLMAFRREMLGAGGFLDEKFKFYRTCDIEFCFRVKDRGLRAVVVSVPVQRHEQRMWANTPVERREQLSKRNYYRFLDRFRGRFDLTVSGEPPEGHHHDPDQADDHDSR